MKEQNYLDHLVGVFGQPVAENPGVIIQDAAFAAMGLERWHFLTLDVDKDQLENAINGLKAFKMRGINCTIPHKIAVMQYLDEISESAQLIGAVNTIVNTDGRLYGDNTDGKGFMMSLESNGIDVKGKRIVVLGAGGAARAICVEMALAGAAHITIVSRPGPNNLGPSLLGILQTRTSVDRHLQDPGRHGYRGQRDERRPVSERRRDPEFRSGQSDARHVRAGRDPQSDRDRTDQGASPPRHPL